LPDRRAPRENPGIPHFLYKLIPPRPTFPADMTEKEGAVMEEHFGYWAGRVEERQAVAYGPVMDPSGMYGIAVMEVADESAARVIAESDPAITSSVGFGFEVHAMPDAIVRS
jgi:uncharacterized protein